MIKRNLIITVLIIFSFFPLNAQVKKQENGLKREVTLYNPYKPTLPETKKQSFLPDMNDTSKVRPSFNYDVKTTPFLPQYKISPIKAASLLPDPLPKLYKSFINIGLGNYLTPLAELSISNERSKKGSIGLYARHFSTNGNIELDNGQRAFAGYMDNDASLYGRRLFRKSSLEGSLDYTGKTRHAYGYDPLFSDYFPSNKETKLPYSNMGAKASFSSLTLDSTKFAYDFRASFNYFTSGSSMYQRKVGVSGLMSKSLDEFYIGSGLSYDSYHFSDFLHVPSEYVASVSPFLKKKSEEWNFKLGLQALLEKDANAYTSLHVYPDINFSFNLVPAYINFFAGLSGKLEKNEPMNIILENPYLLPDGSLYKLPNTSHNLIITAGLKGNTGLGGNYLISGSYSVISNMLFYSNIVNHDSIAPQRGNYFEALTDDVNLLNMHAEMNGPINDWISFNGALNLNEYTLSKFQYAWDKPGWDAKLGLKYNLRDKIIAGMEICVLGKRHEIVNGDFVPPEPGPSVPAYVDPRVIMLMPAHFNLNLSAEYRYSKILSFWTKINNISYNRYDEWSYYPTHRFLFMVGLTYSL